MINFIFKNHISYIDYCGGVYTYSLNDKIDLLKYLFDASKEENDFSYTKNVQLVLKYYFLKPVRSYTSREVAAFLKISPSSVSRANELLNRLGVLDKSGYGAGTEYKLLNKKSVLKIMEEYFIKPYDNSYFLAVDEQGYKHISSYPVAGQDALSQYTDLMPEKRIPTFAISKKEFKSFYDSYMGVTINNPPHYVQVQSYIYEPNLFTSGDKIDLFDLYITMLFDEDLNDPRVLAAFNNIKEQLLNGK